MTFKTFSLPIVLLLAALVMLTYLSDAAEASKRCDDQNPCKFGGKCDDGYCNCRFDCRDELWGRKLHCGLATDRMKFFRNLCHLRSRACALQRDIPIIEMAHVKDHHRTCVKNQKKLASKQILPATRFCQSPSESSCTSHKIDGGICLNNLLGDFCKCPSTRTGEDCERYQTPRIAPAVNSDENHGGADAVLGIEIPMMCVAALVVLLGLVAVILKYRKKSQPKKLVDFRDVEDSNNIVKIPVEPSLVVSVGQNTAASESTAAASAVAATSGTPGVFAAAEAEMVNQAYVI